MVLPWLAAAWVIGLAAAPAFAFQHWQWITLAAVAVLAAWATRREARLSWAFLALGCAFLGALRATLAETHLATASITGYASPAETVDVGGYVVQAPAGWGQRFVFDLRAEWLRQPEAHTEAPVNGLVRVFSETWSPARRGERVVLRGRLRPPTRAEGIGSSAVLEADSIRRLAPPLPFLPTTLLDEARELIVDRLHEVLPAGEASLVAGVLLGADERMPEDVQEAFRATGTAHILAVSGFNVTIVAAAAATAFGRILGARRGAVAAGAAVVLYTLLCGAEAAVVRAALMAGVALVALRLGRQSAAAASLAAAAIVMSLLNPAVIYDAGFQLSFLATLGLVLLGRPAQEAVRGWGERAIAHEGARSAAVLVVELAVLSLIAQAATLPLSAYLFHRLPLLSLPANALILPAQPLLMATGAATAAASLVSIGLGHLVAWSVWPLAAYTIRVAELFASLPGASLNLAPLPAGSVALVYVGLGALLLAARWPRARKVARDFVRLGGPAWLFGLAALTTLAWRAAVERPDGRLVVTAYPGGEVVVETPTGRFLAIGPGPSLIGLKQTLNDTLPITQPALDWLILTHPEVSPAAAFGVLGRNAPSNVLLNDGAGLQAEEPDADSDEMVRARLGTRLDLGHGSRLEFVDSTSGRATILITYGLASVVIAESQGGDTDRRLSMPGASAVVLLGDGRKVAAALRGRWSAPAPRVVVAAPLPGDPFPADPIRGAMVPVAATPLQGWIRLSTDGTRLWLEAERVP